MWRRVESTLIGVKFTSYGDPPTTNGIILSCLPLQQNHPPHLDSPRIVLSLSCKFNPITCLPNKCFLDKYFLIFSVVGIPSSWPRQWWEYRLSYSLSFPMVLVLPFSGIFSGNSHRRSKAPLCVGQVPWRILSLVPFFTRTILLSPIHTP